MSRNEVNELLGTMQLGLNNLPKILTTDPQVKKLGAKLGDVLEMHRSEFGKSYSYYRYVVEG